MFFRWLWQLTQHIIINGSYHSKGSDAKIKLTASTIATPSEGRNLKNVFETCILLCATFHDKFFRTCRFVLYINVMSSLTFAIKFLMLGVWCTAFTKALWYINQQDADWEVQNFYVITVTDEKNRFDCFRVIHSFVRHIFTFFLNRNVFYSWRVSLPFWHNAAKKLTLYPRCSSQDTY